MATFQKDYYCSDCNCALPDDSPSYQCDECFEKEKFEKESTYKKHKDFLSKTPTKKDLKQTIKSLDETLLANFTVSTTNDKDQILIDKIRKKCVYDACVEVINAFIEDKCFEEIETVLETYDWDDNSLTDTSPRDALIELIENKLKQIPGIKIQERD